jgi:hypothetical protein
VILISVTGGIDPRPIMRLEILGQLKNAVPSSGIKLATFYLEFQPHYYFYKANILYSDLAGEYLEIDFYLLNNPQCFTIPYHLLI